MDDYFINTIRNISTQIDSLNELVEVLSEYLNNNQEMNEDEKRKVVDELQKLELKSALVNDKFNMLLCKRWLQV